MKNIPISGKLGAILAVFGMFAIADAIYSTSQMRFLTTSYVTLRNGPTDALQQLIRSQVDIQFIRGASGTLMLTPAPELRLKELARIKTYRARFAMFMGFAETAAPTEAPAIAAVKSNVLQFTAGVCSEPAALRAAVASDVNAPPLPILFAEQCAPRFDALSYSIQPIIDPIRSADLSAGAALETTTSNAIATTFDLILGGLALVMLGGFFAVRAWVVKPIDGLRRTMGELAGGALQARVSGTERKDEIGGMARAVQVFKDAGLKKRQLEEEARAAEAALRDSEDHYRHMVELHPQIPWTAGPDGGVLEVGPKWYQLSGMTREETLRYGWMTRVHPDDVARIIALREECVASGRPLDCECRIFLQDGRTGWFRSRAAARLNHQGQIVRWYGTLEDITDRHMAEADRRTSEALAFRVLEATKDAVIVFDRIGRTKYANAQATGLFGSGAPLTNLGIGDIFPSRSHHLLTQALNRGLEAEENSHSTFFCEFSNLWLEANIYTGAEKVSLFLRDISDKKRAEEQLSYAARHDSLTGILNRGEFFARFRETIARQAPGKHTALFCLDVDNFKDINDVHGHPVGDRLLQQIVERLSSLLRPNDLLARPGGDEFMLAQAGIATEEEAADLAAHILHAMAGGFTINELVIAASMSIGIAMAAPEVTDVEAVYKQADIALYQSKTNAKGNFRFFHPDMQEKFDRAHRLRLDLMTALENEELYLAFQPIIRTSDGAIIGAEALLRWRHPTHGLISPAEFIPIAEDSGLICDIGSWALHQACHAAQAWPAGVRVSVNVSPRQFELGDIVQTVSDALRLSGLAPDRLQLEITELVFISKESSNLYMMNELQNLGLSLVLDDFGTGYSSLSYLDTFHFDLVKIDRSFIAKSTHAEETQPLLEAIIGITSALKLLVTAEGVETPEQFARVRKMGCHYAQGYLFGRPGTEAEFLQRLHEVEFSSLVAPLAGFERVH